VSEAEQNHLDNTEHEKNHHAPAPYWKRPHIQWGFWIGVALMGIALIVYIFSLNLALVPRSWHQQAQPTASGK
jgi:hypothetical protein